MSVPVKILMEPKMEEKYGLPVYAKEGDAGMDVRADIQEDIRLMPSEQATIPTGVRVRMIKGYPNIYEIQVRSRSGLAHKYGVHVLNSPGTIDSEYINSIGVIIRNSGNEEFVIKRDDKIAQIVLKEVPQIEWVQVYDEEELGDSERGLGGFGHTGRN